MVTVNKMMTAATLLIASAYLLQELQASRYYSWDPYTMEESNAVVKSYSNSSELSSEKSQEHLTKMVSLIPITHRLNIQQERRQSIQRLLLRKLSIHQYRLGVPQGINFHFVPISHLTTIDITQQLLKNAQHGNQLHHWKYKLCQWMKRKR